MTHSRYSNLLQSNLFQHFLRLISESVYGQILPVLNPALRDKRARVRIFNILFWYFLNWKQPPTRNGITPTGGVLARTDIFMTLSNGEFPLLPNWPFCPQKVRLLPVGWRVWRPSVRLCKTVQKLWLLQMGFRLRRIPPGLCPFKEIRLIAMGWGLGWPSLRLC